MTADDTPLQRLLDGTVRTGRVEWLGVRPARHAPVAAVSDIRLTVGGGVEGDHYHGRSGTREVSLIAQEDLAAIAAFMQRPVGPERLRRNILVSGINLLALKGRRFRLGDAVLEYTGDCHPCSRMEIEVGEGGYNAVRGHGGILARVVAAGSVRINDALSRLDRCDPPRY